MEFTIGKPARSCRETERRFEHGEKVYSVVRYIDGEYAREDFCETAWDGEKAAAATASWTTPFYDPAVAEQEPAESFSPLRQAFYEFAENSERDHAAAAFLAAELLRRQKAFRRIKEADSNEDARITLYNDCIANRLVEVRDPNLSLSELNAGRLLMMARVEALEAESKPAAEEQAPESMEAEPAHGAQS